MQTEFTSTSILLFFLNFPILRNQDDWANNIRFPLDLFLSLTLKFGLLSRLIYSVCCCLKLLLPILTATILFRFLWFSPELLLVPNPFPIVHQHGLSRMYFCLGKSPRFLEEWEALGTLWGFGPCRLLPLMPAISSDLWILCSSCAGHLQLSPSVCVWASYPLPMAFTPYSHLLSWIIFICSLRL